MSWKVKAVGKTDEVDAAITNQFHSLPACADPEASVRRQVQHTVAAMLSAQEPGSSLIVVAGGSRTSSYLAVATDAAEKAPMEPIVIILD